MSELKIYLTDNPNPIVIPYKRNNTETSLILPGPDSCNYGEHILSNLLHLLENFCNQSEPDGNPLLGQTYYNSNTKKLNLYGKSGWVEIDNFANPHNADVVYVDTNPANITGSTVLSEKITDYISIYGNNKPTKVYSTYKATNAYDAVTIGYVNEKLALPDMYYVTKKGISTMEGPLKLQPVDRSDDGQTAVNIGYINNIGKLGVVTKEIQNSHSENNGVVRLVIYDVVNRKTDDGSDDNNDRFAAIYFSDKFSAAQKVLTIGLPITLNAFNTITCNCVMVNSTDRLIVKSASNTTVVLEQLNAKVNYVHGCVYGTISNSTVNSYINDNQLTFTPISVPEYVTKPRTVVSVPDPDPTPSPSPSASIAASPVPTPSPSESLPAPTPSASIIPVPTPSPSESEAAPVPTPTPSESVAIPVPTPTPSESAAIPVPTPSPSASIIPIPTPSPSESAPLPTPTPSPSGSEPLPTPTPSPSESTPLPSPTPTASPSPSPTPTPTPTPSHSKEPGWFYNDGSYDYFIAPVTTQATKQWFLTNSTNTAAQNQVACQSDAVNSISRTDGSANTDKILSVINGVANTNAVTYHPVAAHCFNLTSGNYSDWYLPSITELNWARNAPNIINDSNYALTATSFWSSTMNANINPYALVNKADNSELAEYKYLQRSVRAVRRQPV